MESVSSDASVKATQAVKFPLPDGNYSNYGVVKILCKYPCFCVILLLPSRGRWEKLEGTTSWPAVLRREFFFHFRLVFCHFVVIDPEFNYRDVQELGTRDYYVVATSC